MRMKTHLRIIVRSYRAGPIWKINAPIITEYFVEKRRFFRWKKISPTFYTYELAYNWMEQYPDSYYKEWRKFNRIVK